MSDLIVHVCGLKYYKVETDNLAAPSVSKWYYYLAPLETTGLFSIFLSVASNNAGQNASLVIHVMET